MKGLSLKAKDRYQTVDELVNALYYSVLEEDENGNPYLRITKDGMNSGSENETPQPEAPKEEEFGTEPIVISIGKEKEASPAETAPVKPAEPVQAAKPVAPIKPAEPVKEESPVKPAAPVQPAKAEEPAKIDSFKTGVNFKVKLELPGEYYKFQVDMVNDGSYNAKIYVHWSFSAGK